MLKASWGHSKMVDLTFHDYIESYTVDAEGDRRSNMEADVVRKSGAPLRNLWKDLDCVMRELQPAGGGGSEGDSGRLPLLSATHAAIHAACSERGLKDSAFVSLLELLTEKK